MKQRDYKEIARIIKIEQELFDVIDGEEVCIIYPEGLSNRLADYFEREDKEDIKKSINLSKTFHSGKKVNLKPIFNRKQFLTGCGVKK
jgi:hypothetical protein|tara:strand:+ start:1410 stop:1673 length:264 start_codon:yes stop_codon:yes gene_type:complete